MDCEMSATSVHCASKGNILINTQHIRLTETQDCQRSYLPHTNWLYTIKYRESME